MASPLEPFFICHNPAVIYAESLVNHIYHQAKPRFMSALFKANVDKDVAINFNGISFPFMYTRGDQQQQLFVLVITDMIDRSTTSKFSHILQQAVIWHVTCLNKVDEKVYGTGSWSMLADYHDTMPGIKAVQVKKSHALLLFFQGGVRTFKNDEDLTVFLENNLNYPVPDGLEVKINAYS